MFARIGLILITAIMLMGAGCDGSDGGVGTAGPQGEQGITGEAGVDGLDGLDGRVGTSGKSVLLNYSYAHITGEAMQPGSYSLLQNIEDDMSGTVSWEAITRQVFLGPEPLDVVTALLINNVDGEGVDRGDYLNQIQAGHVVTLWLSQRKWADYRIASVEMLSDGRHRFGLAYAASDDSDGTEDISLNPDTFVQFQWSRAQDGEKGDQGLAGETGATGDTGATGEVGIQGEQGIQGFIGMIGAMGAQGIQGIRGFMGLDGDDGSDGSQGLMGDAGSDGFDGTNGNNGINGIDGEVGPQGPVGPAGPPGQDADDSLLILLANQVQTLTDISNHQADQLHRIPFEETPNAEYIKDLKIWTTPYYFKLKAVIYDDHSGATEVNNVFAINIGIRNRELNSNPHSHNGAWAFGLELFGAMPFFGTGNVFQSGIDLGLPQWKVNDNDEATQTSGQPLDEPIVVQVEMLEPGLETIEISIPFAFLESHFANVYTDGSIGANDRLSVMGFYNNGVVAQWDPISYPSEDLGNFSDPLLYHSIYVGQ